MYTDRDDIKEDIRRRLVKIKGIGPEKAAKGSDTVMEYLDSLVERQGGGSPKPGERDEDGIKMIKRPKEIPEEYRYLYWDGRKTCGWLHHNKPQHYDYDHYNCDEIEGVNGYYEASLGRFMSDDEKWMCNNLPEVSVEDRIVRLVD